MDQEIKALAEAIDAHSKIVFFSGEGMSAECDVPVLAEKDTDYESRYGMKHRILLSSPYLRNHPQEFYRFFRNELGILAKATPSAAHKKLASLEQSGKLLGIVTTNRDSLHQKAGSNRVIELNGSVKEGICTACGNRAGDYALFNQTPVPCCARCGSLMRPAFALTGEGSDQAVIQEAIELMKEADMLVVAGTRLTEYPGPEVVTYFRGKPLVSINPEHVPFEQHVDIIIRKSCTETFAQLPF